MSKKKKKVKNDKTKKDCPSFFGAIWEVITTYNIPEDRD